MVEHFATNFVAPVLPAFPLPPKKQITKYIGDKTSRPNFTRTPAYEKDKVHYSNFKVSRLVTKYPVLFFATLELPDIEKLTPSPRQKND